MQRLADIEIPEPLLAAARAGDVAARSALFERVAPAVLGIILTKAAISGPPEEIGHKVAAALVGTFLGILISYGFLNPLAVNMHFVTQAEHAYNRCIANSVKPAMAACSPTKR